MKFRGHETFFIRKGWLYKGLKNVVRNNAVFIGDTENPMDVLGIGSNMVKALRYWLKAVDLTEEPTKGRRVQSLTVFGDIVYENDRYMEELGTLWLLHYKLAKNVKEATAWYFFFNEFKLNEFTRDDFILQLTNYIRMNDSDISPRSLEDDFNCIINTYVPRARINAAKVLPENNMECPIGELGLVDVISKSNRVYKKCTPNKNALHPLIALSIILDQAEGQREIKISSIQNDKNNIGKICNLDVISLVSLLSKIEHLGHIKVVRTAGLDVVRIITDMSFTECVNEYYAAINN